MKQKKMSDQKGLLVTTGLLLVVCIVLSVYMFFVPEEKEVDLKPAGILLYDDGTAAEAVSVRLEGMKKEFYFGNGDTVFTGTLYVNDEAVFENLSITFDEDYGYNESFILSVEDDIGARLTIDGKTCLLIAPAETEREATNLLAYLKKSGAEWLMAS